MVGRYTSSNTFVTKQEEEEIDISPENSGGSPVSASSENRKLISSPLSTKKSSKRSMDKRVVTIPISEVEASRLKGETTPPSDSWAWRKYGQKPIKGSPYPRGYYRCSGSKGCPARKQVERSHLDPTVLLVTYSCEHNHPLPSSSSRNHHRHRHNSSDDASLKHDDNSTAIDLVDKTSDDDDTSKLADETNEEHKFGDLAEDSLLTDGWFAGVESTSSTRLLESPLIMEMGETGLGEMMVMQEEEESLFADLGELPGCSVVFRRNTVADRWFGAATL